VLYPALLAGIAALYVAAAKLGLSMAFVNPSATPVWPPAGIALAALLIFGLRAWPAIFAGALLANLGITGWKLTTLCIAAGNTLEAVVGAYLVDRFAGGRRTFERAGTVFRFVALAALASTVLSATTGVTSLVLGGFADWSRYGPIWVTWWLGDVGGDLVVAPPLVLWASGPYHPWKWRRSLEGVALFGSLALVAVLVFSGRILPNARPLAFACIPFLIWAAFRFGRRTAATAMLVLGGIATWGTLRAAGPFSVVGANESMLLLQAFLGVCTVITLTLAALVAEGQAAQLLLEERVAQRTHELREAMRRLQDAQDALVRHERLALLGELASGVSHELRNPLGVMSNAVYYLGQVLRDAPHKVREYLDLLRGQITLSERIVSNLLDLARVRASRSEPVDLREVVQNQLQRLGGLNGIAVRLEVPADLRPVLADEVQVGQIVLNLLTNAVQAMGEAGGTLSIRAGSDTPQRVRLEVADSGPGIPPDHHEKIFEPLFSTKARGMGLGLPVSRTLARANAGDVTVTSRAGEGATFTLILPIAQPPGIP
jgi:signal transduction histidine kinase